MQFEFNKRNLIALLLIVHQHRRDGFFFRDFIDFLSEAERVGRKSHEPYAPSRATWFNYFHEIDDYYPDGLVERDIETVADEFVRNHQKAADKFFRKFTPNTFAIIRSFLLKHELLTGQAQATNPVSSSSSLYFSLIEFLKPKMFLEEDQKSLPGMFRVYRPSLSTPGKILISAARISLEKDGALRYMERMHFRTTFGWREQNFKGYIVGSEGRFFLLTKDDSTNLPQYSVLKPLLRRGVSAEISRIEIMAGLYTGASHAHDKGLFSTGIVLAREDMRGLERYPLHRWKIGHLRTFGLQERNTIPEQFLEYLIEY